MTTYARVKRYRERLRSGATHAHIEISRSIGETMVELGYLPDGQVIDDPKIVGEAFWRFWREQYVRRSRV